MPMKSLHEKRLLKLAAHLKAGRPGGHKLWNFCVVHENSGDATHCGTAGCAMGELPVVFPKHFVFLDRGITSKRSPLPLFDPRPVGVFFGLDLNETFHVFYPESQLLQYGGKRLKKETATANDVAANILAFIKKKKHPVKPKKATKHDKF